MSELKFVLDVELPDGTIETKQVRPVKIKPGETVKGITNFGDVDAHVEFEGKLWKE